MYSGEGIHTNPTHTCRLSVILEYFTQHQLVGILAERVPKHGSRNKIHVAVGALRLVSAGTIKVPLR
jgi:hypothetical protein